MVFNLPWDDCNTQEKLETRCIRVYVKTMNTNGEICASEVNTHSLVFKPGESDDLVDLSYTDRAADELRHRDVTGNYPGKFKRFLWEKIVLMLLIDREIPNQNNENAKGI